MRLTAKLLLMTFACALASCSSSGSVPSIPTADSSGNDTGHYAGTYYPLYNEGVEQWIEPTDSTPFDKVSDVFAAFAHAYPQGKGGVLAFEQGQPKEPERLQSLEKFARAKNPHVKVLITLGWAKHDWDPIAADYQNNAGLFVPSVVAFLRQNKLDGFDIDDEGIGGNSGSIDQPDFDGVIAQLRSALDKAAKEDRRKYDLVITPAGNNSGGGIRGTQIDANNLLNFDWINLQTYWDSDWSDKMIADLESLAYPRKSIAVGVDTGSDPDQHKERCTPDFPAPEGVAGLKGIFNWTMSADSDCKPPATGFKFTLQIAKDVGYSI